MSDLVSTLYEPALLSVRKEVAHDPTLSALLDPQIAPELMERFLIEYCAQGVQITEPVERWIRRAGERCKQLDLTATGEALIKHAVHEAGHQQMFIDDTHFLTKRWNQRNEPKLSPQQLLSQRPTRGMCDYIALHEQVIAGDAPFAQVAIEYEIERLSVDLLPSLMQNFERKLGADVLQGLSFLTEHAAIDVGHTHLNRKMMERLLAVRPDAVEQLVDAGTRALRAYMRFFAECMQVAEAELAPRPSLAARSRHDETRSAL